VFRRAQRGPPLPALRGARGGCLQVLIAIFFSQVMIAIIAITSVLAILAISYQIELEIQSKMWRRDIGEKDGIDREEKEGETGGRGRRVRQYGKSGGERNRRRDGGKKIR
jgi:hypothetical protein